MRRAQLQRQSIRKNRRAIDTIIASLLMVVIVVIASVMVFTWSTGLFGALLIAPKTATENISLEYTYFAPTNNNVSMSIRNDGSTPITLKSYYISDGSGDTYARLNWAIGPSPQTGPFAPATLDGQTPILLISSACGASCTVSGTAFTFVQGQTYTVTLITSINTSFRLTIIR